MDEWFLIKNDGLIDMKKKLSIANDCKQCFGFSEGFQKLSSASYKLLKIKLISYSVAAVWQQFYLNPLHISNLIGSKVIDKSIRWIKCHLYWVSLRAP